MTSVSSAAPRRVVITGVGFISPLGSNVSELWDGLSTGRSGVVRREGFGEPVIAGVADQFTGGIDDFGDLEGGQKKAIRKGLKLMCRETQMAVAAAQLALANAAGAESFDPERVGVVMGSDYMLTMPADYADAIRKCGVAEEGGPTRFDFSRWGGPGLGDMQPLWMLKYLPNMPASHIAIYNDLRGPNNSLTMREASGPMAIGEAARILARGSADRMLAGATGTRILPMQAIHALQTEPLATLSADNADDPATACRPFATDRNGMVCGEGAGMIVLETLAAATARGAKIYGELLGFGSSVVSDNSLQGKNDLALANAMRLALADAKLAPQDLGHVNAHGLATPDDDRDEARAIRATLGDAADSTPVTALKSYFGNLGAGSGMVEFVGSLLALEHGQLPMTLNCKTPDPECPILVANQSGVSAGDTFVALSTTPQGQAAAVCVRRAG
ncbi:beta-ketoacyl-[acyl-carrier-protein] synthase family protein [Botrimarina hoheduenensis]|uniref:3-oxoacyl-[acyl-carrier-protein] synthase 2 n=1 Tax=Botrimarina hoheduenensis TaxID=2528000 RepID=A0A5C5VXQ6_9BACT|nr:beta-ketoacyl-[acyl-carrier-protein] synthase family protein [Botrimarina hoheduenensis]TWT42509.1 3-oxoacyl-[acyl-carrier-protein] synthase 2 [Botrimarina hoheduenensis]